jgi:hypothetical protein
MQAGDCERAPGLDLAGDIGLVEPSLRAQRDAGGSRVGLVALFDRRLQGAQRGGIHH